MLKLRSVAYGLLLWAPYAARPNLLSLAFTISRMALLSTACLAFAVALGVDLQSQVGNAVVWAILVVFEELARLSMLQRAETMWRAGVLFVVGVVGVESIGLYRPEIPAGEYLVMRLPTIILHVSFTALQVWMLKHRNWLFSGVAGLCLLHWIYDVIASQVGN